MPHQHVQPGQQERYPPKSQEVRRFAAEDDDLEDYHRGHQQRTENAEWPRAEYERRALRLAAPQHLLTRGEISVQAGVAALPRGSNLRTHAGLIIHIQQKASRVM